MTKILCLAKSGFGKTASYCGREKFGIRGLDPAKTFVIQCVNRNIPSKDYPLVSADFKTGNRIQVGSVEGIKRFEQVAKLIEWAARSDFQNIVVDDFNYLQQDYYMANAMNGGWDTPKRIGFGMASIFNAFEKVPENKNLICLAHYEEYKDKNGDSLSFRFKSVGNMVDTYITPEGKFDIILYGKASWNEQEKKPVKQYVVEYDGEYPAKDSLGILDSLPTYIPNDLGIVVDAINKYYE